MNVGFKVNARDLVKLRQYVQKELTRMTEEVALRAYNTIVLSEYPYYSGSYISSWNIKAGSPNTNFNEPSDYPHQYDRPSVYLGDLNNAFGQPIYITNATPHAYQVEVEGTPTHPDQGWFIAAHAVSQTVLSYKFSFRY